ncbi:MAG: hypothetical protein CYG60_19985 [Actinobacteria bacterium]|nr:MAG: hypothetical protein CYG60_19985 [Actinomycetota bacterium]
MAGFRQGEALGLKWSDVDLDAGSLRVNRQLQRVRRDGDKSGKLEFSEPKNASRRTRCTDEPLQRHWPHHRRADGNRPLPFSPPNSAT